MPAALKAVVYGVLVDVGGSIAAGMAIALAYGISLAAAGASPEDIERAMSEAQAPAWLSIVGFVVGCAASFLGGFVCARVAAGAEMKWVGVVAAVSGIVSLLMGSAAYAFEWNAVLALVGMGAVFAGGWAGVQTKGRPSAP
jgi:hypothetical protein